MKTLKTKFTKNDKTYILIKRNEKVALYGLTGEYSDEYTSFEVVQIYIQKSKIVFGRLIDERETITPNSHFGKDFSRSFPKLKQAENYFNFITDKIHQDVHKQ